MARLLRVRTRELSVSLSSELVWLPMPVDMRNCDAIPDRLSPVDGCPACGSAWVEVDAVGFLPEKPFWGRVDWDEWMVEPLMHERPICAVQLRCFEDHAVASADGLLRVVSPDVAAWSAGLVVMGAALLFAARGR